MNPGDVIAWLGGAVALVLALGTLYAVVIVARTKGRIDALHASLDAMAATNGELRDQVQWERNERANERHSCEIAIAELRAHVEVLEGEIVTSLVASVSDGLRQVLREIGAKP